MTKTNLDTLIRKLDDVLRRNDLNTIHFKSQIIFEVELKR